MTIGLGLGLGFGVRVRVRVMHIKIASPNSLRRKDAAASGGQSCTRVQILGPNPTRPTEIVTQPDQIR